MSFVLSTHTYTHIYIPINWDCSKTFLKVPQNLLSYTTGLWLEAMYCLKMPIDIGELLQFCRFFFHFDFAYRLLSIDLYRFATVSYATEIRLYAIIPFIKNCCIVEENMEQCIYRLIEDIGDAMQCDAILICYPFVISVAKRCDTVSLSCSLSILLFYWTIEIIYWKREIEREK